jgi:hypothetical protein
VAKPKAVPKGKPAARRAPATKRPNRSGVARWVALGAGVLAALVAVLVVRGSRHDAATADGATPAVGGDLHSLVVDPANDAHLFVGGHEAVAASVDAGKTWTQVDSLDNADAMGWGFAAHSLFVSGHPGLNRSDDGGRTWRRVNDTLPDTDVHAFGSGTKTLYGASPNVGVFASTDDGRTWSVRSADVGRSFFGRIVVGTDDDHLFAADAGAGVAASSDGGRTWRRIGPLASAAWLSRSGTTLVASGPAGAAISTDDGQQWADLKPPEAAALIEAARSDSKLLYAAGHHGASARIWVSRDGGQSWRRP